ncbi:MAG: metal-dependent phosphoesterase [Euryarchaeota archaeon RBG_13_31_8]|nr:MAG: metal-dependent phosphoesterase [Euryarchaeota archaeon RBG_13_31_8]
MIKLDLHIHSQYSEDGIGSPKEIIKVLLKKGLQGMAITDHNNVEGGLQAKKVAPKDFIVIPGVEISTNKGHIIALDIKENIKKKLSVEETIEKIIDIGGVPTVPHLFRSMSGIKVNILKEIHQKISAIEVFNSCSDLKTNLKTIKIAKNFNLGGVGGSDSHIPEYVGFAYTTIDSTDYNVDSILSEINNKKSWGEGNILPLDYRTQRMIKSIKQYFNRGFKRI